MTDDVKMPRAGRVLRFTVTSALVVAPVAGCSKTVEPLHINSGPTEVPTYSINPGPDDAKPLPTPAFPIANPMPPRPDAGPSEAAPTPSALHPTVNPVAPPTK